MKIVTDTASLFSTSEGKIAGITVVPACVICEGQAYKDYEEINPENFLDLINEDMVPTTSQPAIGDLLEVFEENNEEILGLFIGDGLSGGYQNAVGAKNSMDENDHIRIIDTKTLAGAEHYLVQKAVQLRETGYDLACIEKELKVSIEDSHSFVIPADFEFLKRSGRLTPIGAKIGAMIKIVPVLTQTEDMKKITLFSIKRSWKKATEAILDHLKKKGVDENYVFYICHGGDLKIAETVVSQTKAHFPHVTINLMGLSPTMITHGGPGCVLIQAIRK